MYLQNITIIFYSFQNHIILYRRVFVMRKRANKDNWNLSLQSNKMKTRIDVYETLCPQQMLVHKGGKIKNWGGECRDVTPTKSLSQNIRVDGNREVKFFVKIQKIIIFFLGGGGGGQVVGGRDVRGMGHRVDVNKELKFL